MGRDVTAVRSVQFDEICRWSELKLEIVGKYGAAYTTALSNARKLKKLYIDGYSGAGDHVSRRTGVQVEGSPARALKVSPKRIAFARRLVKTTDQAFTLATAEGKLASIIRTRIVPVVLPALAKFEAFREFMFRTVSQVSINYRQSYLSEGEAGDIRVGDRLP